MVEIGTMQYKRVDRFPIWLTCLMEQTMVSDFRLNIWNNTGSPLPIPERLPFPVRVFQSDTGENVGSQARFLLARHFEGPVTIFLDDDVYVEPTFVETCVEWHKKYPEDAMGRYAMLLQPGVPFYECSFYRGSAGKEVDWIGTGACVQPTKLVKDEALCALPVEYCRVEDMYWSAWLYHRGVVCRYVPFPAKARDDKFASYKTVKEYGERAYLQLLKEGWKLRRYDE